MAKDILSIALHFLKFRPRTIFEIEQKLKSKKIAEAEIKKVIGVLRKQKLLDDQKFAKMWVRDRNLLKPTGSFVLKLELKRLGIGPEIIEEVLKNQDEEELAREALAKFKRRLSRSAATLPYRESKTQYWDSDFEHLTSFLKRRGFSMSVIFKIIKKP